MLNKLRTLLEHMWVYVRFVSSNTSNSNTTDDTSRTRTVYPSKACEVTPGLLWGSCNSIFSFLVVLCTSLFCLFVILHLAMVVSVVLRFTAYYPFGTSNFSKNK